MTPSPSFEDFCKTYDAGSPQVVSTSLVADLETPVSATMKLSQGERFHFLLESVEGGAVRGRYTIIGIRPDLLWRSFGDRSEINRTAVSNPEGSVPESEPSLISLRNLLEESEIDLGEDLPPMAAGIVGYMGYDVVRQMEHLPDQNPDALGLPDSLFMRPTLMAIFDSVLDVITLVTPVRPTGGMSAIQAYQFAEVRLKEAVDRLSSLLPHEPPVESPTDTPEPVSNTPKAKYLEMVDTAKEYVTAGDVFQVVLSQRFSAPFTLPPLSLYRALRRTNPSPFMYFLNFDKFSIVGSSPEILVRSRDGKVTVRPIAGTRPRGTTRQEDAALAADLLADPKERAEHLMLLDLGRNDVGRVAVQGSVTLTDEFIIERYSHVMHIVSEVEGDIADGLDAIDVLQGGFPAGTVSGAPKVRAMQIIDELEMNKRGPYAGGVGYFSANGGMDTCIVLRTAILKDGIMHVQAGAGIVADSDPESEYQECRHKARALFRAAEEARGFVTESF